MEGRFLYNYKGFALVKV